MGSVQPPTKPCHNCRRQRLRCDRSYPHCNKCAASGKECLGYGKLFRWTGAIASRGKLAGRTSSAPVNAGDAEDADAGTGTDGDGDETSQAGSVSPVSSVVRSRRSSPHAGALNGYFARRSLTGAEALQVVSRSQPASPTAKLSSPWVLVDPLFQGLDQAHRFYLNYCASNSKSFHFISSVLISYRTSHQSPPVCAKIWSPVTDQTAILSAVSFR